MLILLYFFDPLFKSEATFLSGKKKLKCFLN